MINALFRRMLMSPMNLRKMAVLLLALLVIYFPGWCARSAVSRQSEAQQTEEKEDSSSKKTSGLHVLPIIDYSPETSWGFGVAGISYFQLSKGKVLERPSNIVMKATYTLNKQFSLEVNPDLYFRDGYHALVFFNYSDYPSKLWGIGNDTPASLEEDYTSRYWKFTAQPLKRVYRSLNLGFQYHYSDTAVIEVQEGGELAAGTVPGSSGGAVSGLGFLMNWDSRDSIFFPTKGSFHQFSVTSYGQALGSDFSFSLFSLDARKYFTLSASQVLGLAARVAFETGNPPFWAMSLLGGDSIMRGYYLGRYRDKNMISWQVEYRWTPAVWRLGVVAFLGFGDVADKVANFKLDEFKYSLGFGLRYVLNKDQHLNIRLDFGFGKGNSGVYLTGGEAF